MWMLNPLARNINPSTHLLAYVCQLDLVTLKFFRAAFGREIQERLVRTMFYNTPYLIHMLVGSKH